MISYPKRHCSDANLNISGCNNIETYLTGNFETIGDLKHALLSSSPSSSESINRTIFLALSNDGDITLLTEDQRKPSHYDVIDGSTILITNKLSPRSLEVTVNFEKWSEKRWFYSTDEVSDVKRWVEEEFHVPPRRQILDIFRNEMHADMKLEDYAINERPSIRLREIAVDQTRMIRFDVNIEFRNDGAYQRREKYCMENRDTLRMLMLNVEIRNGSRNWKSFSLSIGGIGQCIESAATGLSFEELGVVDGSELNLVLSS